MGKIREPQQKRSIEKKNKIIEAAFKLFCEKGYHRTNTVEIAKEAGVSTGILYDYFENKKAIYLDVYKMYTNMIAEPMLEKMGTLKPPFSLENLFEIILDFTAQSHSVSERAHDEMMAMVHLDKDTADLQKQLDMNLVNSAASLLKKYGIDTPHLSEKLFIILELIELYSHEVMYHKHESLDFSSMKETIINLILSMLVEQ